MKIHLLIAGLASVVVAGAPGSDDPIIIRHDRPDARHRELAARFPSLVHVNLPAEAPDGRRIPDGEGVLVAPRWVLTAAHVAAAVDSGHALTVGGEPVPAEEVVLHPEWEDGGAHDIALVRLARETTGVDPAPLYRETDEAGRIVWVVGYGDTGTGLRGPAENDGHVRAATNRIDEASPTWLKFRFDDPRTAPDAATDLEGISGPGDSGGPGYVIVAGVPHVAGISSGQSSAATGGRAGVYGVTEYYTRVSSYLAWIDGVVERR